jgi:hypothetical protein
MIILQYEGAYLNDGKGLSDWDVLTHETPGDGDNDDDDELYLYTDLNRFLVPSNISFSGYKNIYFIFFDNYLLFFYANYLLFLVLANYTTFYFDY